MLSDAGHCVPWMQTVKAALLPNEQQITPESVWQTEISERKVKENEEKYKKIIFVLKNIRIPIRSGLIIKEEIK